VGDPTADELRERVRHRYAKAARAVLEPVTAQAARCDSAGCCGSAGCCVINLSVDKPAVLAAAGFAEASVTFTALAAPGMHSAIIRAVKPGR
jgi:hypothetical protein